MPAVLRAVGLDVVEVDGWRDRGSDVFTPIGVTWHATAGSRRSTDEGELETLLTGSETAPAPVAQLLLNRQGRFYVVASGRCNHNKVGWAGPNRGLGNTHLLGIECMNDNKGEEWPQVQLNALRLGTAALLEHHAWSAGRVAGHYEHQPYKGRPAGETSTKSDPAGIIMATERPRLVVLVADIIKGRFTPMPLADDMQTVTPDVAAATGKTKGTQISAAALLQLITVYTGRMENDLPVAQTARKALADGVTDLKAMLTRLTDLAEAEALERPPTPEETADAVLNRLGAGGRDASEVAQLLAQIPGVDWIAVGQELSGERPEK